MNKLIGVIVCACVVLCAFNAFGQNYVPYTPGSTANVPPLPQPQPMYQPQVERPMYPVPVPQPMVVQSANDSAMLEAVKQGKGFNLRVDLVDPNERQYQYQQAQQYQYQQPMVVTPYQCPQQARQYYDSCGRPIYWDGYRWRYYQQQSYWYPGCNLGF